MFLVQNSDRILVMDNGTVAEFDTPERLLQNPEGIFSKLVAAANDETLYAEVRKAGDSEDSHAQPPSTDSK